MLQSVGRGLETDVAPVFSRPSHHRGEGEMAEGQDLDDGGLGVPGPAAGKRDSGVHRASEDFRDLGGLSYEDGKNCASAGEVKNRWTPGLIIRWSLVSCAPYGRLLSSVAWRLRIESRWAHQLNS